MKKGPNIFERTLFNIGVMDADQLMKRAKARSAMAALDGFGWNNNTTEPYYGASKTRSSLRNLVSRLVSSDRNTEGAWSTGVNRRPRETIMARSRHLVRNEPYATGHARNTVQAIVGDGLELQSQPDGDTLKWSPKKVEKFSKQVENEFRLFAMNRDLDVARKFNFYELTSLITMHAMVDGDVFFMCPQIDRNTRYKTRVQIVPADKCSNPYMKSDAAKPTGKLVAGVDLGPYGDPLGYYFSNQSDFDFDPNTRKWTRYEAFDAKGRRAVHHLMLTDSYDQTRGMSIFAPVIEKFHMLGKYSDAELTAAVVASYFTVFINSKSGKQLPPLQWTDAETTGNNTTGDNEYQMGPGAVVQTDADTEVKIADPSRPNANYDPFVTAIITEIAVGVQMPREVFVMSFSSNYSASRAAILMAWRYYETKRTWIAHHFCQPIFELFMDEAVSAGRIKAPGYFEDPILRQAYLRCIWLGQEAGSIDPLKDANAANVRLTTGVTNLDEESMRETGIPYTQKHARTVEIANMRREAGLATPGNNVTAPVAIGRTDADPEPEPPEMPDPADGEADDAGKEPPKPGAPPPPPKQKPDNNKKP